MGKTNSTLNLLLKRQLEPHKYTNRLIKKYKKINQKKARENHVMEELMYNVDRFNEDPNDEHNKNIYMNTIFTSPLEKTLKELKGPNKEKIIRRILYDTHIVDERKYDKNSENDEPIFSGDDSNEGPDPEWEDDSDTENSKGAKKFKKKTKNLKRKNLKIKKRQKKKQRKRKINSPRDVNIIYHNLL